MHDCAAWRRAHGQSPNACGTVEHDGSPPPSAAARGAATRGATTRPRRAAAVTPGAARPAATLVVAVIVRALGSLAACGGIAIQLIHRSAIDAAAGGTCRWLLPRSRAVGRPRRVTRLPAGVRPPAVVVFLPGAILPPVDVSVVAGIDVSTAARGYRAAAGAAA